MENGDKVIVSGRGQTGISYLECTGYYQGFSEDHSSKLKVKLLDKTEDIFDQDSVRLWDYR